MIRADNLTVIYNNGITGVENVSFELTPGQIYGLVGMNGAGKSTIFKSIMGLLKPASGEILIADQKVQAALKKNLVAYVPQTENVDWNFPVLVRDVVMMGRYGHMGLLRMARKVDHDAVDQALERVGLLDIQDRQIGELSGGQRKRVFVARALAQQSDVILLDEPFTGVDIATEKTLIELFQSIAKDGRLILVSTHNLGSVPSFCDQVLLVNKTLLASGPVETTFTQDNLARAFGGMLRHVHLLGDDLHDDEDARSVSVLTDDESALVFYGEDRDKKIVRKETEGSEGSNPEP